ncbi:hypothetical protein J6590_023695 [Homalodisca vitripennis]|nr:hypothetical protein J6590_023695 [Homalodisca vitripennis]
MGNERLTALSLLSVHYEKNISRLDPSSPKKPNYVLAVTSACQVETYTLSGNRSSHSDEKSRSIRMHCSGIANRLRLTSSTASANEP